MCVYERRSSRKGRNTNTKKEKKDMKKRWVLLMVWVLIAVAAMADVVVLQSGKKVEGKIVLDNEEVVIIKTSEGPRFQFPKTDVKTIQKDGESKESLSAGASNAQESRSVGTSKAQESENSASEKGAAREGAAVANRKTRNAARGAELSKGAARGTENNSAAGGRPNGEREDIDATTEQGSKKATLAVEVNIGGANIAKARAAGMGYGGHLMIGTHNMLNKGIFLGGSIGYTGQSMHLAATENAQSTTTGYATNKDKVDYHFLPIALAARIPLLKAKHSPMIGMDLGYGVALSKEYIGGMYSGLNIGYKYCMNQKQSLYIAANCSFQQAFIQSTETIEGNTYSIKNGQCLIQYGLKVSVFL